MRKRLVVIGGVAAGPKSAAKARRCDPELEITLYQEEDAISYAGCGLPYYISGLIKERQELISRTPGQFAQDEIRVKRNCRIEKIDIREKKVWGRNLESGESFEDQYDQLVLATGAKPIQPNIEGVDLKNIFFLRSIFHLSLIHI